MNKLTGKVVSTKMNKTIIVEVKRQVTHPVYRKILIRTKKYKVHNEDKKVNVGDRIHGTCAPRNDTPGVHTRNI